LRDEEKKLVKGREASRVEAVTRTERQKGGKKKGSGGTFGHNCSLFERMEGGKGKFRTQENKTNPLILEIEKAEERGKGKKVSGRISFRTQFWE